MLLHAHGVELVEGELADALNQDSELTAEEGLLSLKIDLFVNCCRRENIVTDADVVIEDSLQLG